MGEPRQVGGRAGQADADEADGAVAQLARGGDRHHLVLGIVRHGRGPLIRGLVAIEVTGFEDMLAHPTEERVAVARDRVPTLVEGIVARVVAMGIGRRRASRHLRDRADHP